MTPLVDAAPMEINLLGDYDPNPKQVEYHTLSGKYRLFTGGWGNGKTSGGCAEALTLAVEFPGSTGLISRKTRPELKATTQDMFFNGAQSGEKGEFEGCPQELIRKFNRTEGRLELINSSVIHFWPLDDPSKLQNLNLGWYLIDQAEEVTEEMFLMLEGRLRQMQGPRQGLLLANPAGHDWVWKRFVDLEYPEHRYVHAKTTDNPNLPPDYIETLMRMPEAWRKRFMEGSFDVFEGQIYPEFDPEVHTINPIPVADWWEIYEGIDHGRRNPTAILWAAFDDMGNCFIVDEHYEAGRLVGHHAGELLNKRQHWGAPEATIIDASAAQQDPNTGRSVIDEYFDHGIVTQPSDRHVLARLNRMAEWMRLDPEHPHPLTGETREEGWPRLYICKNCVNLIEHIQQYKWKPKPPTKEEDAKDEPLKKDDHDVDALGYILMSRPSPAEKPIHHTPESLRTAQYWKRVNDRIAKRGSGKPHSKLGTEA